jgi:phospholipid/cholesterol/gamma-HCH transport system substrate-binding protein
MKKDWLEREMTMEVVVGVFVGLIFLGMMYFTILLSKETMFTRKPTIEVKFNDVMGLREGDFVVVRGMTIGKIKTMMLRKDGVYVKAALEPRTKLRLKTNYRITIISTSILGGRYMQIHEGGDHSPLLPEDAMLFGQDPYDLMADAAGLINSVRKGVEEGKIMENLQDTVQRINHVVKRVEAGEGTLGELLAKDSQLSADIAATVKSLRTVSENMSEGKGTIGKLMGGDELYSEILQAVKEVRATVDDFRETSPIATFASVFFGAL